MRLTKHTSQLVTGVPMPAPSYFCLPEKIIQFGTGALLRGLPDCYVHKANTQGMFNGRIVGVKSTGGATEAAFAEQDNLYTHCIGGISNGMPVNENTINASISRVLHAPSQWPAVLACAADPQVEIVISNTTEVGIVLQEESIHGTPPSSYPAKLLAFLYTRFTVFAGAADKGMIIVPTELITDNGSKLKDIITALAIFNQLPQEFIAWLNGCNQFCNSLVDRIVTGKPSPPQNGEEALGYVDELLITSEPYSLWAIETNHPRVREKLSFWQADESVVITPDISTHRELKLRLLNGTHTFCCGLALLAGFASVGQAVEDEVFAVYLHRLMFDEIAPSINHELITDEMKNTFASAVLDRFANPYIVHRWLNITLQYSLKMRSRNVQSIKNYIAVFNQPPACMALGLAAYILFMHGVADENGVCYSNISGNRYAINDEYAPYYASVWQDETDVKKVAMAVLSNQAIWGESLLGLKGFAELVCRYLSMLVNSPATQVMKLLVNENVEA